MKFKKQLSFILSAIVAFSLCAAPFPAYAEVEETWEDTGLCPHHLEHTEACGYAKGVLEQPCIHSHDASCGYTEAVDEIPCNMECTDADGDGIIDHMESCIYQPAVEGQPCSHQHDETCGCVAPVEESPCSYAVNGCPYCIVSWEWPDAQQILTESGGNWELALPGVSESNLVTRETLAHMLPDQITAVTDSGESLPLEISWDLTALPESGAWEGEYILVADLVDGDYALTENAAPMNVTLQLGGAETYGTTLPSGDVPFSEHLVNGVSPNGTTIDLFDYWLTNQTDSDNNDPEWVINKGINANHALIFEKGAEGSKGNWNVWTGTESPRTGIVQDKLADGYPKLNIDTSTASDANISQRDGTESLAYLFDPDVQHTGKASYEDVHGLLQVDSEGYYYYDSKDTYATYYADTNSFSLYEYPGVLPGGSSPVGQFFPFNTATADAIAVTYNNQNYTLMNDSTSTDASINHYFGMHMSTRFIQQNGGHTDGSQVTPVTYEFSGDDDVWIFIDGILVADLGGIHNAASVSINFATGDVYINDTNSNGQQDSGEDGYSHYKLGKKLGLTGDTLPDNTYHTLDFFYLERGNTDSNLYLKYNLVTIPESDLIKVDQLGDPVEGAEFTLYSAKDYEDNSYNAVPIATGTTDSSGEFVFLKTDAAGNSLPITIDELYNMYGSQKDSQGNNLVLVETETPAGYRHVDEIGLYFYQSQSNTDEILLMSNSIWDKGAYAMPKVTTTTSNSIQLLKNANGGTEIEKVVDLVGNGAEENPLMFAVVFQKHTNADGSYSWLPVSGDPLNGWTVQEDSSWSSVLAAAQDNPYIFQIASSGAYQVEINNLPGDIQTYYHICKDLNKAEYTIAYYYTEAETLASASENNTWRIESETKEEKYDLSRIFSVDLYVTNVKNYLLVQKVDEDGATVNGAEFSLYKKEDVTVHADGTVTVNPVAAAYDTLTTANISGIMNLDGGGAFPTEGHVLEAGEYYLIETSAPIGYKLNDNAVHVVVDNSGVYADAGTTDDGITVLRGVGSIVRSMLQFAADDDVDTTLNAIKAAMATDVTFNNYDLDGSFTFSPANWAEENVLHLRYANANKMLDYGLYDDSVEGTIDNLTFSTETGWSKLLIRQCYQHDDTVDTSLKTDLKDQDITNLFSGSVTVRVSNDKTGNLKISKTVTGEGAPNSQEFSFTVKVTDEGTPISGTYETLDATGNRGSITFSNGQANVTLKAGENITILALPEKANYTVKETNVPDRYTPTVTVDGDDQAKIEKTQVSGTIQHNTSEQEAVHLAYTNAFNGDTTLELKGVKTIQGRKLRADDSFSFSLEAGNTETTEAITTGKIVMPAETTVAIAGSGSSDTAEFSFDEITFKSEGTYVFKIAEILPPGVSEQSPVSGEIWYDTHVAEITVTVTRDAATGILQAVASYDNTGGISDTTSTDKAVFTNLWASLIVNKTVSGNMGDRDKLFDFQLTLTDAQGTAVTGSYRYILGATPDTLTLDQNGTADFQLKHGQEITIYGLPEGSRYNISEPGAKDDGYTVEVTTGTSTQTTDRTAGILSAEDTVHITFENQKGQAPVTGLFLDRWPWLLMAALILIAGTGLFFSSKRSRKKGRAKGGKHFGR